MAKSKEKKRSPLVDTREPWIQWKTGILIIAVLSIGVGVYTGYFIYKELGIGQAILWGIGSAIGLWVLFGGLYLFNRLFRGR